MSSISERETPARGTAKDVATPSTVATNRSNSEATPHHIAAESSPQRKEMSSVAAALHFGTESPFAARTPLFKTPTRPWKSPDGLLGTPPANTPNPAFYVPTPDPFERNTLANYLAMGSITEMLTSNASGVRDSQHGAAAPIEVEDYCSAEATAALDQGAAAPRIPAPPPLPPTLAKAGVGAFVQPDYFDLLGQVPIASSIYPPFSVGGELDLLMEEALLRETALMMALASQKTAADYCLGLPQADMLKMGTMAAWPTQSTMFEDDLLESHWPTNPPGKKRIPRPDVSAPTPIWNDFKGYVVERAKEQAGCRALQQLLQEGPSAGLIAGVHAEVGPHFVELMMDPFGNYLVQVLLEVCTVEQRGDFLSRAVDDLAMASLDMHGTRATQKIVETVASSGDESQIASVCAALESELVVLIKDVNGNHVVQKCLQCLPAAYQRWIFKAIEANCLDIATHRHGCCVVQRCLDHGDAHQHQALITEVFRHARALVSDAFGNYVIQYSCDIASSQEVLCVVESVISDVEQLACEKFSSNVLEKFLDPKNPEPVRERVVKSILDAECCGRLLLDSFGNYVMQKAVAVAGDALLQQLLSQIRPVVPKLRESVAGQRILQKLSRRLPELGEGLHTNNRGRRWRRSA